MSASKKPWVKSIFSLMKDEENSSFGDAALAKKPRKEDEQSGANSPKVTSGTSAVKDYTTDLSNNWMDTFAPTKLDELAVHAKKLAELQEWLQSCEQKETAASQICVLTGPTGCGKTTTIKLLAHNNNYQVQEWVNPVDMEVITTLDDTNRFSSYIGSQVEAFKSFLWRASRYKSLFNANNKRLLIVEDFPNALISDSSTFASILEDFLGYGDALLVFVVADAKSKQLNIAYNLFTDEVKNKLNIKHISFNAIASTLINKAIKRFCTLMAQQRFVNIYKVPPPAVVEGIAFSAQGDVRNALINLHFASLKGAPSLQTKQLESSTLAVRGKRKRFALQSVGRDESITMMHVLGRIFNPKYNTEERFIHTPESLVDLVSSEPKKLVNFMHANYLQHFSDIDNLIFAVDGLSLADVLFKEYREEILSLTSLNIAIRSLMVANKSPVAGWKPVRGPMRLNTAKPPQADLQRYELRPNLSANLFTSEYSTFIKVIKRAN